MKAATLARLEHRFRRHILRFLTTERAVKFYSTHRKSFLERFARERVEVPAPLLFSTTLSVNETVATQDLKRTLWGMRFNSPLMNAAGMFKNGEAMSVMHRQGAGAYLGGTSTADARIGNEKNGVRLPFVPYAYSGAASNWLGLPNDGDEVNVPRSRSNHYEQVSLAFPVGWSVMRSPSLDSALQMGALVKSMRSYEQSGIDFLELNESCPNTSHGSSSSAELAERLKYISERFLRGRSRTLPVIVKFSTDMDVKDLPQTLDMLYDLGFDGVNLGNTSTDYAECRKRIDARDYKAFDYFTKTFGGGVSGRPLKERSLELAATAVQYQKKGGPNQEFHVIRTGGIENAVDLIHSQREGILLNQWFTGYWNAYGEHGNNAYEQIYRDFLNV